MDRSADGESGFKPMTARALEKERDPKGDLYALFLFIFRFVTWKYGNSIECDLRFTLANRIHVLNFNLI